MEEFTVDFRINRQFNGLVAANFSIEGTGAAVLFVGLVLSSRSIFITGLALVMAGVLALFLDLASPARSWRSILRPGKSWISRGALCIGGLVLSSMLLLIIPDVTRSIWGGLLATLSAAAAVMTMLYTGLLVSSMRAIPSWNTRRVPMLFFLHSSTSAGLVLLSLLSMERSGILPVFMFPVTVLMVATAVLTLNHAFKMGKCSGAGRESARMLLQGKQRVLFLAGALGCGFVMPLILIWVAYTASGPVSMASPVVVLLGLASRMAGDFSFRLALLRTGVYEPVIP
ncbi:MAG: dimethyl sulfoxide reductase anchor subunit [Desulfobacterales bacterium]|nr:dimethyl sulfoxide reductase anchor subunit [Desulfobacterales bacterium]